MMVGEAEDDIMHDGSSTYFPSGGVSTAFSVISSAVQQQPKYDTPVLATKEHAAVVRYKFLVALVLFLAMIGLATTAFVVIRNEEEKDFEDQFQSVASEISSVSKQTIDNSIAAAKSFSLSLTSFAEATNETWPYVTVRHYSNRAEALAEVAGATRVWMATVVEDDQRSKWENYTRENVATWYADSIANEGGPEVGRPSLDFYLNHTSPFIFWVTGGELIPMVEADPGPYLPLWHMYPLLPNETLTNANGLRGSAGPSLWKLTQATRQPVFFFFSLFDSVESVLIQPIFETISCQHEPMQKRKIVAYLTITFDWSKFFSNILQIGEPPVTLVIENDCSGKETVTFQLNGPNVVHIGPGNLHDRAYTDLVISSPLLAFDYGDSQLPDGECVPQISMYLYPTSELDEFFHTTRPVRYFFYIVLIFVFTSLVFVLYDLAVNKRQEKFQERVVKQDRIMKNVFPTSIRDRLISSSEHGKDGGLHAAGIDLDDIENLDVSSGAAPLAELYPSVTVCSADIAGFTSWSSAREPPQIFLLLETLYGTFDKILHKHNIFKVETVGDCYVAVAGLPEPRYNHAVAVARFAREILHKFNKLTNKLEVVLGPDTADLGLRVGLSSGQVTAGVLRGERARFQLFGDTVNTAGRMEKTSVIGRIQMSPTTVELLKEQGKSKWVSPRSEPVSVKGKGQMQTYWLLSIEESLRLSKAKLSDKASSHDPLLGIPVGKDQGEDDNTDDDDDDDLDELLESSARVEESMLSKTERLVEWNVKVLSPLLQQILAARKNSASSNEVLTKEEDIIGKIEPGSTILCEFKPIIELKRFGPKDLAQRRDPQSIEISITVKSQLRHLLFAIAKRYQDNPFHNFEHASHVTASVCKLLTRIVCVDGHNQGGGNSKLNNYSNNSKGGLDLVDLAGHSYGITSDPLTQFAVVFSALIHDLDHPGVPNTQLVKEGSTNAKLYKKSIAEQNSVALSWELLMRPEYADLRSCIYSTADELKRFRQLVVNTVMATDIADKELQGLRKNRWDTAFSSSLMDEESSVVTQDRKATIVIEHLIQASDVSHTMQHWHIFQRWNERLFCEMYEAYLSGRADSDPSLDWYKAEIGFFDFYVIPLAKKLEDCGVFGVSSHEYLNYAKANRDEWEREGESFVAGYVEKYAVQNPKTMELES